MNFKKTLLIYLSCAGSSMLCGLFFSCCECGLLIGSAFLCCCVWALGHLCFRSCGAWAHWLSQSQFSSRSTSGQMQEWKKTGLLIGVRLWNFQIILRQKQMKFRKQADVQQSALSSKHCLGKNWRGGERRMTFS